MVDEPSTHWSSHIFILVLVAPELNMDSRSYSCILEVQFEGFWTVDDLPGTTFLDVMKWLIEEEC